MPLMPWNDCFVTGIELVDNQHRRLVDLINQAAPRLAASGEKQAADIRPLLGQLTDYAKTHFTCEEALMREAGVDPAYLARHTTIHAGFADEVARMAADTDDAQVSGNHLLRFLTSWLTFHILSEDQDMARRIRTLRGQMQEATIPPGTAVGDQATRVLNDALIDLFAVVTQRNQTLRILNEELKRAKTSLEQRVAERTRELDKANTELRQTLEQVQQTQGQLLQSEKMAAIGQLAAGVAHEINNPIGFVTSNVASLGTYVEQLLGIVAAGEQIESAVAADHPGRLAFQAARNSADLAFLRQDVPQLLRETAEGLGRISRIVNALKNFSRVDGSERQDVDVNQCLDDTLDVLAHQFGNKIQVIRDFSELPHLRCNPGQLNQLFMNLLLNAIQAIDACGTVTLRTRRPDTGHVSITITDTGHGIPESIRQKIFDPFFTTKPVGKGTGLGLSMSWDIVRQHGGRIEVSGEPDCGATFEILLPLYTAPERTGPEGDMPS